MKRIDCQGFTNLEIIITVIIIGVITAIGAPSLYNLRLQTQLKNDTKNLENIIQLALANIDRKSRNCTITIPAGAGQTITSNNNCLQESFTFEDHVVTNNIVLAFSYRGALQSEQTLILSSNASGVSDQYCITFGFLGTIRSGQWIGGTCRNLFNLGYDNGNF